MAHDAFISYASEDHAVAAAIRTALAKTGINCWMAPDDITPGQSYAAAITSAVKGSRALLLVFSPKANEWPHASREVERAVHGKTPIVAFRIEQVEPSSSLEYFISSVHWLNASNPPQKGDLERLAQAVKGWLDGKEKPA